MSPIGPVRREPVVFLSAGESSGDRHGAAVARALAARLPGVRMVGLGGRRMREAGVELLATLEDLAVMGSVEVLRRLPFFLGLRRRVHTAIRSGGIDLVLLVDYPGFNLPLARFARARGLPVLYFIAPQVWAWREGRARALARDCDRVLTVLPFEDEILARHGVDARFVGHPLLDDALPPRTRDPSLIGLFPGSRADEVRRMFPVFAEAARRLRARRPELRFVVARPPHLSARLYGAADFCLADSGDVLAEAGVALTKSGTITLELALAGTPMVVGYRMGRTTHALAKRLVRVPAISLVNLVAGRSVIPELIQDALDPAALSAAVEPLLEPDGPARLAMLAGLAEVRGRLGEPGCAVRVAEAAIEHLSR